MRGWGLSTQPKPVRTGHLLASFLEEGGYLTALAFLVGALSSLRPGSLWLALQPERPEPGDAEGGKRSVMRPVNKALLLQSGTVRGCEETLQGIL